MEIRKDYMKILREIDSNLIKCGIEIWKSIAGYDNYVVSNTGKVKNVKTRRILKCGANSNGYSILKLCNASKKENSKVVSTYSKYFYT